VTKEYTGAVGDLRRTPTPVLMVAPELFGKINSNSSNILAAYFDVLRSPKVQKELNPQKFSFMLFCFAVRIKNSGSFQVYYDIGLNLILITVIAINSVDYPAVSYKII
jgi:hypothetical protein